MALSAGEKAMLELYKEAAAHNKQLARSILRTHAQKMLEAIKAKAESDAKFADEILYTEEAFNYVLERVNFKPGGRKKAAE